MENKDEGWSRVAKSCRVGKKEKEKSLEKQYRVTLEDSRRSKGKREELNSKKNQKKTIQSQDHLNSEQKKKEK
jgi:hypothetical protein